MGKSNMQEGIKQYVHSALDSKDEIAALMIDAGVDPKQALLASTVVTKRSVDERLDRHMGNRSAAQITTTLSDGVTPRLN